ncbi:MAG: inositol monophosphatase family protein [Sphingomicrobium sp.]
MSMLAGMPKDALADVQAPVEALIREVAATTIMPRYQQLGAADVSEKTPGEIVTIADQESERMLTDRLADILPGGRIIGEEACAADPQLVDGIGTGLVWIVDPLDGTANFAAGREPFGIIVALALDGVTLAGWLYDPVSGRMCYAALGQGAYVTERGHPTRRLLPSNCSTRPIAALATQFMPDALRLAVIEAAGSAFDLRPIPRCAAEHYPRLCERENHVALFQRTLAWDHAAGALLLTECGGHVARWNGTPYRFDDGGLGILAATSRELWNLAADCLLRSDALEAAGRQLLPQAGDPAAERIVPLRPHEDR